MTEPGPSPGEWLSVNAAARRLGVSPKAIRGRIQRGTLQARPVGNHGREVLVPPPEPSRDPTPDPPEDPPRDLAAELERERIARITAEAELAAHRILVGELRLLLEAARAAPAPWWRRWIR